ncbi:hypothetical protein IAH97_03985 [Neoehrlichia mikurensis]|uniref:hypothetical protein n=1 Tax=Neoehrlichia mikurensis TaxID=89586 RepID=UPI001C491EDE|nr:hypothetical protein [Neoehrlichia mikurensis]QXK91886.1 hypothetical protein IAH97_03985 [Neoehrlichia mikurensis]
MKGILVAFFLILYYSATFAEYIDCNYKLKNISNGQYVNFSQMRKNIKSDRGYLNVRGWVLSYALIGDFNIAETYKQHLNDYWMINYDTVLNLDLVSRKTSFGVLGANLQLLMPMYQGRTGSAAFIYNNYGKLSVGYQEGIESNIKVDALSVAVGDTSNVVQCIKNFFINDKINIPNLYSGLYSATLSSHNESGIARFLNTTKEFMYNLPFRVSYSSLANSNLVFGLSYMPLGYQHMQNNSGYGNDIMMNNSSFKLSGIKGIKFDKQNGKGSTQSNYEYIKSQSVASVNIAEKVPKGDDVNVVQVSSYYDNMNPYTLVNKYVISPYKHVISGAASYMYNIANTKIVTSIIGEYAKSGRIDNNLKDKNVILEYYDLIGVAVGVNVFYQKFKLGCAYGHLGKSGIIKSMDFFEDRANSFYWNFGGSYKYNDLSLSFTYIYSNMYSNASDSILTAYLLKDFTVGVEYLLCKNNKMDCKLFNNYHIFTVLQDDMRSNTMNYNGIIILLGMKLEF